MKIEYKCAICTIIKDEQRYLQEWIEYCLSIGFRDIFLYEDKGSASHSRITDKYDNVHLFLYSEEMRPDAYREKGWKQVGLFHYFIEKYKKQYDWVAFIDPDEYIRFEDGYSLNTLCDDFKEYRGVYLMYKMYGANGHVNRPKGGVVESYGNSESMPYMKWKTNHKSFVNLSFDDISFTSVHHVRCGVFTDFNNRRHNSYEHPEKDLCYKKAWIDHYFTKSWEDWVERFEKRGDVLEGNRKIEEFFRYNRGFDLNVVTPYVKGLNLGCGKNKLKGWLNTDLKDELFPLDATKPLPFYDESFEYVYSEHMVEHLAEEDGRKLFAEIHRVLKGGGVFRLALPTQEMFERVTEKYLQWHFDKHGEGERTLENLKQRFSTMFGHKKIYSVRELTEILTAIGFSVKVCEIGESEHEVLRGIEHHGDIIGEYNNRIETTIIEAAK